VGPKGFTYKTDFGGQQIMVAVAASRYNSEGVVGTDRSLETRMSSILLGCDLLDWGGVNLGGHWALKIVVRQSEQGPLPE